LCTTELDRFRWIPSQTAGCVSGSYGPAPINEIRHHGAILIIIQEDANRTQHQTRAFNTETAEQLNSWLNSFELQLRQKSDVNYDFFIHVVMRIYAERVEQRVQKKDLGFTFWAEAAGG
jgi:hypothetical protein